MQNEQERARKKEWEANQTHPKSFYDFYFCINCKKPFSLFSIRLHCVHAFFFSLFVCLSVCECVWVSVCFNGRISHIHKPWTGFVLCRIFSFRNIQWMKQWMQTTKHQHTTTTTITTKAINFKWKSERENTHTNTKPPLMATFRWYMACTSV